MALAFPGGANYVSLPVVNAGGGGTMAISCWAYFNNLDKGYRVIAKWGNIAADREYILQNNGQKLLFAFQQGAAPFDIILVNTDEEPLSPTRWFHLLVQHNKELGTNGTAQVWVDGVMVYGTESGDEGITNKANALLFCYDAAASNPFQGRLAEIGMWDRWITPEEIGSLADSVQDGPVDIDQTDLLGYWPCNESSGTIVADGYGTLDGTWSGAGLSWVTHPPKPRTPRTPRPPLDMEEALDALGSHLIGSISYLGSSGTVWLSDDETYAMAGFSKYPTAYGVQLMNPRIESLAMMGRTRRQHFEVDLKIMRKRGGPMKTRLLGTGGSDKGIYDFAQDIESVLLHNRLGTVLDPYPGVSIHAFTFDDSQAEVALARSTFRGWLTST